MAVCDLRNHLRLTLGRAEHLERRQPCGDVEEVPREPLEDARLRLGPLAGGRATSAMNTGISGSVTATMTPEIQSVASSATTTASGTITASRSWGRYSA